jgi:hypothetical protein
VTADFDGAEVMDSNGVSVGKVERTYIDDAGAPRYVEVKFGTLLPKHRLIPVAEAELRDDGLLAVPFDKDTIEGSPDAPTSNTLEPAELQQIDSYYRGSGIEDDSKSEEESGPPGGEIAQAEEDEEQKQASRDQFEVVDESAGGLQVGDQVPAGMNAPVTDRGDVVEVPVLEEVLVKKTVVKEILRVKKTDIVEQETVEGDVQKEALEVDDPSGAVSDSGVRSTFD